MDKYKGVVEIEILGEKRGFKFGIASMAMLCKLENCSLNEVQKKLQDSDIGANLNLYYSAAVQFARLYKQKEPTYEEVCNWIDHLSQDQNEEAVKAAFAMYEDPNQTALQKEGQAGI
ncbi:MAG: hypothetical protein VKL39_02875 [Leptolyngbyaceae bacterium]|nr:hypothetical protein [Leptolyngbyaceae bacterium]